MRPLLLALVALAAAAPLALASHTDDGYDPHEPRCGGVWSFGCWHLHGVDEWHWCEPYVDMSAGLTTSHLMSPVPCYHHVV